MKKKYVEKGDYPLSQEWMNLQEMSPSTRVDLSEDSQLYQIHGNLTHIEERVRTLIGIPLHFIENASVQISQSFLEQLPLDLKEKILKAFRGELGARRKHSSKKSRKHPAKKLTLNQ
jgi:hypothetical protein